MNRPVATFVCAYCKQEFIKRKDVKPQYCSRQCAGKALSQKQRKYEKCETCGKIFVKRRNSTKYCSNKCSGEAKRKRSLIKCDFCGNEFEIHECHRSVHNFCSKSCYSEWQKIYIKEEKSPRWNGGVHIQDGYIFHRQEDGSYKAEHRLVVEKTIGRPLRSDEIVHHLDENKQNNNIDNLVVVTKAEHIQIHRDLLKSSRMNKEVYICH
jgi:hypothetical protein